MIKDAIQVVIIEDNVNDSELMVRALRSRHVANHIKILEDGEKALNYFFNNETEESIRIANTVKVIFLDLKLPKVSGLELLQKLKANEITHKIPVVVITSSNQDPDIENAYKYGANSYIIKPMEFNNFIETVNKLGFYWLMINQKPV